jgi:hypothetical protein
VKPAGWSLAYFGDMLMAGCRFSEDGEEEDDS